jgi:acyl-coenzyme A synthetase/AMP-(fatty) acid ligase/thioesterase domain-containing protein/acyl carrier protein
MDQFVERLAATVARHPDKIAIAEGDEQLSYAAFAAATDPLASHLDGRGYGPGDAVGYLGFSLLRRMVSLVAAVKCGVAFVVLNAHDPADAVADIAGHAALGAVLTGTPGLETTTEQIGLPVIDVRAVTEAPAVDAGFIPVRDCPEAIAYISYTSGSTGRPKGVPATRARGWHWLQLKREAGGVQASDRVALFGQVWLAKYLVGIMEGVTFDCYEFAAQGPGPLSAWLRERRITYLEAFPAMYRALTAAATAPFPDIRAVHTIGEALRKADIEAFERLFVPGATITSIYGSTEYIVMARYVHRHGAPFPYATMPMGHLLEPDAVLLLGADGASVPPGERGEVVVASPFLPPGYHNDPERSAAVFQTDPATGQRRYHTGDFAFYDAAGVLHSAGRADDQIKIRGYTLRTSDVEQEILGFAGIEKVAVAGFPGPRGITRLACHYEAGVDAPPSETMRAALRARMPAYMVPGYWVRHDALPVTGTGKVMRQALPNPLEMPGRQNETAAAPASETERTLTAIWREVLGHGDFGRQEDFFDIGGDSLQAMEVLTLAEQRCGRRIPLETLILEGASIASLAAAVDAPEQQAGPPDLVPLNRPGEPSPLAALHVIGGHLSDYLELAHAFDGVRPMLGIGPSGLGPGATPDAAIDAIASHAATTLRDAFPDVPPALIGFSAGGAFALETARILAASGKPPALILLDANCAWLDRLRWFRSTWRGIKKGETQVAAQRLVNRLATAAGYDAPPSNADEAHLRALLDHRPEPLSLPRSLLVLGENGQVRPEEAAEWRRLLGPGLEVLTVPGDHMHMIRAPHVGALAQKIEAWLRA